MNVEDEIQKCTPNRHKRGRWLVTTRPGLHTPCRWELGMTQRMPAGKGNYYGGLCGPPHCAAHSPWTSLNPPPLRFNELQAGFMLNHAVPAMGSALCPPGGRCME